MKRMWVVSMLISGQLGPEDVYDCDSINEAIRIFVYRYKGLGLRHICIVADTKEHIYTWIEALAIAESHTR